MAIICVKNGRPVGLFAGVSGADMEASNPGFACYQTSISSLPPGKLYSSAADTLVDDPNYVQPPEPPPVPAPAAPRHITPLAFLLRFTKAERVSIEWAAVDKADRPDSERQMAAALRADLKGQEQARFIDLDNADLVGGVTTLETYGLIAAGRAAEILSAPVQPGERA